MKTTIEKFYLAIAIADRSCSNRVKFQQYNLAASYAKSADFDCLNAGQVISQCERNAGFAFALWMKEPVR